VGSFNTYYPLKDRECSCKREEGKLEDHVKDGETRLNMISV
jgi:hypothetical protein